MEFLSFNKNMKGGRSLFLLLLFPFILNTLFYHTTYVAKRAPHELACLFTCDKKEHQVRTVFVEKNDREDLIAFDYKDYTINVKYTEFALGAIIFAMITTYLSSLK